MGENKVTFDMLSWPLKLGILVSFFQLFLYILYFAIQIAGELIYYGG